MTVDKRRFAAGVAAWVFGLASTVLLISLWGRAVVGDTEQLSHSLSPLAESSLVADRVAGWLEEQLVGSGLDRAQAADAGREALRHPGVRPVLEDLVAATVIAAAAEEPAGGVVDVADLLLPRSNQIATALGEAGLPVTVDRVEGILAGLDPLVIRDPEKRPAIGASSSLAANLGTAALLSLAVMAASGWLYTRLEGDRVRALRSLLHRFGLGALSFAVILRIGSWATDPGGGRAPVGETISRIADSEAMLPLLLGLSAMAGATLLRLVRRYFRPEGATPRRIDTPRPQPAARR